MASPAFERSLETVSEIATQFKKNESHYLSPKFHEADARQLFIDKFWDALGWDIYHRNNPNPYEREVRIEKNVMVEGRGKRADYAFYTSPNFAQARFMAEAKKPARNLKNPQDCFQAVRYGWNSNTPLSVLTDFEEFLILDSRYKPNIETAANSILKSFHYTDFTNDEKFSEIYFLFSREAVLENSIEKYVESLGKFKGARKAKLFNTSVIQPIDQEFLKELDEQRLSLARAFKIRNQHLDSETLTEITQRTLDRLVFLRFLEDKLVEADSVIDNLGRKSGSAWRDFVAEMPRLNKIYNGTLFKPHALLDNPNFAPDEYAFSILRDWLSHQNSAYDFNLIPIHILGSIYERFLGKTIETTQTTANVVEKPEVRKAGGVYYTPEYIVRYIVENTVGRLIKGKTPEEISGLRFADIACGSGSFLLGIFDYLIAYHVNYYSAKTRRAKAIKQELCRETPDGTLQLTIHHKKEILLNNIYGVDLDAQAVEVAQFSLYLKLLEEETTGTKQQFLAGYREQLLPSLNKNIIHGNSLIDYDIMDEWLFDTRELKQLNPMNFQSAFPGIFQKGGFDAVVGNPPYDVMEKERGKEFTPHSALSDYGRMKAEYQPALGGKLNLFRFFIIRSILLTKDDGFIGMIVPLSLVGDISCTQTRSFLLNHLKNLSLDCFPQKDNPKKRIFLQAKLSTVIFAGEKSSNTYSHSKIRVYPSNLLTETFRSNQVKNDEIALVSPNSLSIPLVEADDWRLCVKVHSLKKVKPLSNLGDIFEVTRGEINQTIFRKYIISDPTKSRLLKGVEIGSYILREKLSQGFREWFDEDLFLKENNPKSAPKQRRIGMQRITGIDERLRIVATIINPLTYFADSTNSVILKGDSSYTLEYLLALLNSKFFQWRFKITSTNNNVGTNEILTLPIRTIDFSSPSEKSAHDKIFEVVGKMLSAKKSFTEAQTDKDRIFYERYCKSLDKQIDDLVYDLYELTNDEIKIVEGKQSI